MEYATKLFLITLMFMIIFFIISCIIGGVGLTNANKALEQIKKYHTEIDNTTEETTN